MLMAVQYTCFPLSDLSRLIDSADIVLTKPSFVSVVNFDCLEMSIDEMYHVMLACGIQYDDVQFISIFCPAITVIDVGVSVT